MSTRVTFTDKQRQEWAREHYALNHQFPAIMGHHRPQHDHLDRHQHDHTLLEHFFLKLQFFLYSSLGLIKSNGYFPILELNSRTPRGVLWEHVPTKMSKKKETSKMRQSFMVEYLAKRTKQEIQRELTNTIHSAKNQVNLKLNCVFSIFDSKRKEQKIQGCNPP